MSRLQSDALVGRVAELGSFGDSARITTMDAQVLKTVGQIAGIGGLALGVFLLLFKDLT